MAVVNQAHTFVTNEVLTAATMNANPAAFVAGFANIDHFNIGAAGIYASQMIPSNNAQAIFGGAQTYLFGSGVSTGTVPLQINAPNGTVVNAFDTQINSVSKFAIDSTGRAVSTVTYLAPGGTAGGYLLNTATGFGYTGGTGAPTHSAPNGTVWARFDSSSSPVYVNTSGASTSGTTWTAVATGVAGVYSAQGSSIITYSTTNSESAGSPGTLGTAGLTLPNTSPGTNSNWRVFVTLSVSIGSVAWSSNTKLGIGTASAGSTPYALFAGGASTHALTGGNCVSDTNVGATGVQGLASIVTYSSIYANSTVLSFTGLLGTSITSSNTINGSLVILAFPN